MSLCLNEGAINSFISAVSDDWLVGGKLKTTASGKHRVCGVAVQVACECGGCYSMCVFQCVNVCMAQKINK